LDGCQITSLVSATCERFLLHASERRHGPTGVIAVPDFSDTRAAGIFRSLQLSSPCQERPYGLSGLVIRTNHHSTNHACRAYLLQLSWAGQQSGPVSSLWSHLVLSQRGSGLLLIVYNLLTSYFLTLYFLT
jgi:hypothetical protein